MVMNPYDRKTLLARFYRWQPCTEPLRPSASACPSIFWCDVILEVHDETVAMGKRSFDFSAVDLVILDPPLELTPDGGDAIHALGKPWVGHGFDADDVGRI